MIDRVDLNWAPRELALRPQRFRLGMGARNLEVNINQLIGLRLSFEPKGQVVFSSIYKQHTHTRTARVCARVAYIGWLRRYSSCSSSQIYSRVYFGCLLGEEHA